MPSNSDEQRPYFQRLQLQFAEHIRNPEKVAYAPDGEVPIEPRRLEVYEQLFFNNIEGFFSQVFPVCAAILGSERWHQIIREYMVKHRSRTPLFHALGEEMIAFFETEFEAIESDPDFLLELAHYEWVELALSISTNVGFNLDMDVSDSTDGLVESDLDLSYKLSPVAWPLAYEWPVHQLSKAFQPSKKPEQVTTLLVYRCEKNNGDEVIDFMTLTPLLYQWLMILETSSSAREAFETVAQPYDFPPDQLTGFALQTLQDLVDLRVLRVVT